jgi:hypothetical protein
LLGCDKDAVLAMMRVRVRVRGCGSVEVKEVKASETKKSDA